MSYTRQVSEIIEFEGQQVKVCFRRLTRSEVYQLKPCFKENSQGGVDFVASESDFFKLVEELLPNCVKSISGLIIDGEPISLEVAKDEDGLFLEIITAAYFTDLVSSIIIKIMNASTLSSSGGKSSEEKKQGNTSNES